MKRIRLNILILLLLVVCVIVLPTQVSAAQDKETQIYYKVLEDNTIAIQGYLGSNTELVIPAEIEGKPVTTIGGMFMYWKDTLTNVVIPESVTKLDEDAFKGCSGLKEINLPSGLTTIGASAFSKCTSLVHIVIPEGVTSIGGNAFGSCTALVDVTIPNTVTTIGGNAFTGCSALTKIVIPESLTSIGGAAFKNCTALKEVNIPNAVAVLPQYLFKGCTALEKVVIPDSVTTIEEEALDCDNLKWVTIGKGLTSLSNDAFGYKGSVEVLELTDVVAWMRSVNASTVVSAKMLYYNGEPVTNLVIPEGVTEIPQYAFSGLYGFTAVTLPASLEKIGQHAFSVKPEVYISDLAAYIKLSKVDLWNSLDIEKNKLYLNGELLKDVVIPESITHIPDGAFQALPLESVTIGSHVKSIGNYAFHYCKTLKTVTLEDGIETIGENAFYMCSALRHVRIPDSVVSIGAESFRGCSFLLTLVIGKGVTSIGVDAFFQPAAYRHVLYTGTEEQWKTNRITENNFSLADGGHNTVHFEAKGDEITLLDGSCCKGPVIFRCSICNATYADHIAAAGDPSLKGDHVYTEESPNTCVWCGEVNPNAHAHNWESTLVDEATCTICGEKHTHQWTGGTCTVAGSCTVCQATDPRPVGHQWSEPNADGIKTCTVCGITEGEPTQHHHTWATGTGGWRYCTICEEGHYCDWSYTSCLMPGWCQLCNAQQPEAPGHDWTVPNSEGTKTCNRCQMTETEHEHDWKPGPVQDQVYCSICGQAHDHVWVPKECATYCSICGTLKGDSPHMWTPATCMAPKTCTVCGATEGNASDHIPLATWGSNETEHWQYCFMCNVEISGTRGGHSGEGNCQSCGYHSHTWMPADCLMPKTCTGCYAVEGDPLGHIPQETLSKDESGHWKVCVICGSEIEGTRISHAGIIDCKDCGLHIHNWQPANCVAPKTCTWCGLTEGEPLPHQWSFREVIDGMYIEACDFCGETKKTVILVIKLPEGIDLAPEILTEEEWKRVEQGENHNIFLQSKDITKSLTAEEENELIKALLDVAVGEKLSKFSIGMYLDIDLCKQVGNDAVTTVDKIDTPTQVEIQIPADLQSTEADTMRTFNVIRIADGHGEVMDSVYDEANKMLTFQTDTFATFALVYTDEKTEVLYGDANGDGAVNAKDAMLVLQFYTKKITEDKLDLTACDVDGNGTVNAKDAMLILQKYTKKIEVFPIEKK